MITDQLIELVENHQQNQYLQYVYKGFMLYIHQRYQFMELIMIKGKDNSSQCLFLNASATITSVTSKLLVSCSHVTQSLPSRRQKEPTSGWTAAVDIYSLLCNEGEGSRQGILKIICGPVWNHRKRGRSRRRHEQLKPTVPLLYLH